MLKVNPNYTASDWVILNQSPGRLHGMPMGYVHPYVDDSPPFYFPIRGYNEDLFPPIVDYSRDWCRIKNRLVYKLIFVFIVGLFFTRFDLVVFIAFLMYFRLIQLFVIPFLRGAWDNALMVVRSR